MPNEGDLRVWWIPQVPMEAFHVPVKSVEEAKLIVGVLSKYDAFQFEHNIRPVSYNGAVLEVFEDGKWRDLGDNIADVLEEATHET